jgi:DNA polymerase-3 subunit delta'
LAGELTLPLRLPWHDAARNAAWTLIRRGVHAILLHGARGIGKKSLAFELATATLCEQPLAAGQSCGTCAGCMLMAAGSHPDFRFIVPDALQSLRPGSTSGEDADEGAPDAVTDVEKSTRASREIRIEQIRALANFANVATHRGGHRVVVLAPAECLNAPAANALLKQLEEPQGRTLFLLCTDAIDELPPTILSRCVLARVEGPSAQTALQWLTEQGCADAVNLLAEAGGAPLAALEMATTENEPASRSLLLELLCNVESANPAEIARRIPRDIAVGPAVAELQRWCWDLLAYRMAGVVRYHPAHRQDIAAFAGRVSERNVLRWWKSLGRRQAASDHPLNARLVVESVLVQYLSCVDRPEDLP